MCILHLAVSSFADQVSSDSTARVQLRRKVAQLQETLPVLGAVDLGKKKNEQIPAFPEEALPFSPTLFLRMVRLGKLLRALRVIRLSRVPQSNNSRKT